MGQTVLSIREILDQVASARQIRCRACDRIIKRQPEEGGPEGHTDDCIHRDHNWIDPDSFDRWPKSFDEVWWVVS